MKSEDYGLANLLPPIGLVTGSVIGARLLKNLEVAAIVKIALWIVCTGTLCMLAAVLLHLAVLFSLFTPTIIIYFGFCFVLPNASTLALSNTIDKAHGSAVISFINMGLATVVVLALGLYSVNQLLLVEIYLSICIAMIILVKAIT
jgi:DHA1 family bicyclomycin/chloramphenicol resistance-like MFS transporter